jgi:hypothetical protein
MSNRYYTGSDGALFVGGSQVAKIRDWTLTGQVDALETTTTGDFARTFIYGIQNYTGSCTALYYENSSSALEMSSMLANIIRTTATPANSTATLRLQLSASRSIEAVVLFTSAAFGVTTGEIVSVDLDFQVTGHLTTATLGSA